MLSVIGFIFCGAIIFYAGRKLSFYGNTIAELTGMGKSWIGLILLSTVTTLPELFVGISASAIVQSADLAVGNVMGSCAINLGILAMMDVFVPQRKTLFSLASRTNILAAGMGIILIALAGIGFLLPFKALFFPGIGIYSLLFIVIFFLSIRLIFKFEIREGIASVKKQEQPSEGSITLKHAFLKYSLFAFITIVAALFLPHLAEQIALLTGLGKTFVGTLFLAASTSLPEIAISIAAIRLGSIDLLVGNLLGANIFNIFILAIDDLFYSKGLLLSDASEANLYSVFSVILMSSIAIIGLMYKFRTKPLGMAWDAILIFMVYITNLALIYSFGK